MTLKTFSDKAKTFTFTYEYKGLADYVAEAES